MTTTPLCIYHGNCADGFGAAWAVWKKHPDWEFFAATYQDPPPDVAGRQVVMVDFSYKAPVLEAMAQSAQSILILDHHKSAAEDLREYPEPPSPFGVDYDTRGVAGWLPNAGVYATFDMERSGAMLAWAHFHGEATPPKLLLYVQDRDLWRFDMHYTREVAAWLFSYPYDFEQWDNHVRLIEENESAAISQGLAIERKHHKDIAELAEAGLMTAVIGDHAVPVVNVPYTLSSDMCHLLCAEKGTAFAACYWDTLGGRVFSLRSLEGGADVSEVAKQYGGGGHKHAAGFRIGWDHDTVEIVR